MSTIASWAFLSLATLMLLTAVYIMGLPLTKFDDGICHALVGILCALIAGVLRMP